MRSDPFTHRYLVQLGWTMALGAAALGCAPVSETTKVPPAPIVFRWPDPAFLPEYQCHGAYSVPELEEYLPRAQVALQLPSTRAVAVDPERGCITVTVESIGAGRLAELLLRGLAVPREAVLLLLV
jgi:hypothetical protein